MEVSKQIDLNRGNKICAGLMWDEVQGEEIDMDLQCVLLNELGQIEDAVFYNQLKSTIATIEHTGDSLGEKDGFDEEIIIDLSSIPYQVKYLAIIVCSYKGQALSTIETSHLKMYQNSSGVIDLNVKGLQPIYEVSLGSIKTKGLSFLATIFEKSFEGKWSMAEINEVGQGKTFAESEDLIKKGLVKGVGFDEVVFQECKNWKGGKSFKLEKNHSLLIPPSLTQIAVGLGWDSRCDIDASALLFDSQGTCVENIYYGNKKSYNESVVHSGDNLTGDGDGDDEVINIDLNKIPNNVQTIWTVITIYTNNVYFNQVSGASCRLVSGKQSANVQGQGSEFCKFNLSNSIDGASDGNIMCSITRCKEGTWAIAALGFYTKLTRTSRMMIPIIQQIMKSDFSGVIGSQNSCQQQFNTSTSISSGLSTTSDYSSNISQNIVNSLTLPTQINTNQFKSLRVQVVNASDLFAVNLKSLSNPYVIVIHNKKVIGKSKIIKNSISPHWNFSVIIPVQETNSLRFKIKSSATFFDDKLGQCYLTLEKQSLTDQPRTHELNVLGKKEVLSSKFTGKISVLITACTQDASSLSKNTIGLI